MDKRINPDKAIRPFLKWPGGKSAELLGISELAPKEFDRYIDPFVGGGSVLFAVENSTPAFCNDICPELIHLMQLPKDKDLYDLLIAFTQQWTELNIAEKDLSRIYESFKNDVHSEQALTFNLQYIKNYDFKSKFIDYMETRIIRDLKSKLIRTQKIQLERNLILSKADFKATVEGVMRGSFYMTIRHFYNELRLSGVTNNLRTTYFFFLRELSYASMFRFNSKGEFNVPYGGITYNKKDLQTKINRIMKTPMLERLSNTSFYSLDYQEFLTIIQPNVDDFVFIDPPYDSIFSNYDNREFEMKNQIDLEDALRNLKSKVMVVIGATPFIRDLYSNSVWNICETDKNYAWNIKSRNDGKVVHLVIRNY
jgi:DNA adenine methylase